MSDKLRNTLTKLIHEYGLDEASKMVGLEMCSLVKISELVFTNTNNYDDLYNLFYFFVKNKLVITEYKGMEISVDDFVGVVEWHLSVEFDNGNILETTVYATPFWDGIEGTPFEINEIRVKMKGDSEYNYHEVGKQKFLETLPPMNQGCDGLIKWFNESYLPETYKVITHTIKEIRNDFEI